MKFSTLMILYAVVTVVYGVLAVLIPGQVLQLYSDEVLTPGYKYIFQLAGAAWIALAVLAWSVRGLAESEMRRAILLALLIGEVLTFLLALRAQLANIPNALGWSTVALGLLFVLGLGYFRFIKPRSSEAPPSIG
jgi:NAD/NADP transhydrogenase beta subunit